MNIVRVEQKKN